MYKMTGGTENGGEDTSPPATVTVNVTAVNDPPVANPQTVDAEEDVPIEITLTAMMAMQTRRRY